MKTRIQDGMIRFEFDEAVLQTIEKALGDMKGQSRKVLKNAVNATAKQARSDLADKAKEEYMAKKSALNSSMKLGRATVSKPEATITVTGGTLELKKFKATTPRSGAKVQITTGGTLKLIQSREQGKGIPRNLRQRPPGHRSASVREDVQDREWPEFPTGEMGPGRRHDTDQEAALHFGPQNDRG